jgi:streptogramin lyase
MRRATLLVGATTIALGVAAVIAQAAPPAPPAGVVVETGRAPCGSAVHGRSLWVGVYEAGRVLQIDAGGRVRKASRTGSWTCRLAVGPTAIWATRDLANEIVRIDRRTSRTIRVNVGTNPFDVLLAAGSLWVSSYDTGTVARLDPRTGRGISISRDRPNPAGLAACGGRIWVGHGRQATSLTAIDPASSRIEHVDVGAATPSIPQCVRGELWVATADSVLRLDPHSARVLARVHLGGTPADIVAAPDGLVWVTDKERSLVYRVEPKGHGIVDSFAAGPGAFALATLRDSVWVTSFAGSDVRSYVP